MTEHLDEFCSATRPRLTFGILSLVSKRARELEVLRRELGVEQPGQPVHEEFMSREQPIDASNSGAQDV